MFRQLASVRAVNVASLVWGVLFYESWPQHVHAERYTFVSGDQTCALGECVTVNPITTIQIGHPSTAPDVFVLDGSGPASAFTRENSDWYHPFNGNLIISGGVSLNAFTGKAAHWVSYTDSGANANGLASNPPAVPNYCGTSGPGTPGSIGGNNNPNGGAGCTPGSLDPTGNQQRVAPDNGRKLGNQVATFTERVILPFTTEHYGLQLYVWSDDTSIVEVLGPDDNPIPLLQGNLFPALTGLSDRCADMSHAVSCLPEAGGKFTASGLPGTGGTYTFNFYSYQTGSDVFGMLWGGAFVTMPEPATVYFLGTGLIGLSLLELWRRRRTYR